MWVKLAICTCAVISDNDSSNLFFVSSSVIALFFGDDNDDNDSDNYPFLLLSPPLQEFDGGSCCVQFSCMVQKGYYPADSELTLDSGGVGVGRMRGTFTLSSSTHPLEAREMVRRLGTSEVRVYIIYVAFFLASVCVFCWYTCCRRGLVL